MTDKIVTAEQASLSVDELRLIASGATRGLRDVDIDTLCQAIRRFIDQHPQPACDRAERMEKALQEIKLRLHFAGWPAEPMWDAGEEGRPRWIADWRYEIDMLENALNGSERRYPERPHSVPRNQLPATPQPAGMDVAVDRALSATVCDGEDVRFYLRASCIVPASNGEADEVCTDSLAREVVRTILTDAGLPALVAECERLRAEVESLRTGRADEAIEDARLASRLAAAESRAEQAESEVKRQDELLQWVERCANHHARTISAQEALSLIQHHPSITAITKSYPDGVLPDGPNPYERAEQAEARAESIEKDSARLRAVTAHGWRVAYASPGWCVFARNGQAITGTVHPTYGAAIDAAIAGGVTI